MSSRLRSIGLRALLLLGGLLAGLALAELGARLYDEVRPWRTDVRPDEEKRVYLYRPNSKLRWVLNPSHPAHNEHGLRDEAFDALPAAGLKRLVVIGDSVPNGVGVDREESFPEVLEQRVRDGGIEAFEVLNAGIPAYTGQQIALFFEEVVLGFKPSQVIVSLTSNDLDSVPVIVFDGDEVHWEFYEDRHGPEMIEPLGGLSEELSVGLWKHSHLYRLIMRSVVRSRVGEDAGHGVDASAQRNLDALVGIGRRCEALGLPVLYVLVPLLVDEPDPMWAPRMQRIADGLKAANQPVFDLREVLATPERSLSSLRVTPGDHWHLVLPATGGSWTCCYPSCSVGAGCRPLAAPR